MTESAAKRNNDITWDTKKAWQGVLAVLGLDLVFVVCINLFRGVVTSPNPFVVGVVSILLYLAILAVVYFFVDGHLDSLKLRSFSLGKALGLAVLFLFAVIIFEITWSAILQVFGVKPPDSIAPIKQLFGTSPISFIAIFLLTVIVAPIAEEIFFRSFLYQAFKKRYGVPIGLLISALIFGLFHFSFVAALPIFVLIGILLGYIFETFQSVYPSILLHALNNFFFFLVFLASLR